MNDYLLLFCWINLLIHNFIKTNINREDPMKSALKRYT